MLKDRVKELSYYLFFGLMVLAKGIGLDSGVRLYYILSAAACLCLGIKLVLTKYSIRQMGAGDRPDSFCPYRLERYEIEKTVPYGTGRLWMFVCMDGSYGEIRSDP